MDDIAQEEFNRLWSLRESIGGVNEVTKPTLEQYCILFSKCRTLANKISVAEGDELTKTIDVLSKLTKLSLDYAKILKLNEKVEAKKKSKFYDLLINDD